MTRSVYPQVATRVEQGFQNQGLMEAISISTLTRVESSAPKWTIPTSCKRLLSSMHEVCASWHNKLFGKLWSWQHDSARSLQIPIRKWESGEPFGTPSAADPAAVEKLLGFEQPDPYSEHLEPTGTKDPEFILVPQNSHDIFGGS